MNFRLPYPKLAAGGRALIADPKKIMANTLAIWRRMQRGLTQRSFKRSVRLADSYFAEVYAPLHVPLSIGPNKGGAGTPERALYTCDTNGMRLVLVTMQLVEERTALNATYGGGVQVSTDLNTLNTSVLLNVYNGSTNIGRQTHPLVSSVSTDRYILAVSNFTDAAFESGELLGVETNRNAGATKTWHFDAYFLVPFKADP